MWKHLYSHQIMTLIFTLAEFDYFLAIFTAFSDEWISGSKKQLFLLDSLPIELSYLFSKISLAFCQKYHAKLAKV